MIWIVFGLALLVALAGAAAGSALITVGRMELTRAASRRLRGGPGSPPWLTRIDQYLAATSAAVALGVVLFGAVFPALFTGFRLAIVSLLLILVAVPLVLFSGYLIPRWLARPRAQAIVDRVIPLLRPWAALVAPLLPSRPSAHPAGIESVLREGAVEGVITDHELLMVAGVMTFSDRPVREVMTPRTDIVAIAEDAELDDIRMVFAQSGYSRIPVYRGTLDDIVGMLHAFDLFKLRQGDPLPVRPVAMAPASRRCGDLLLDMQRERRHLAVVLDEFGGTLGVLTLEDLLEELVGEIFDEHDEGSVQPTAAGSPVFEADGATPTDAIEERLAVKLPAGRATTVGGLIAELAGRIPVAGERFVLQGLEFDVVQASPNKVERILIRNGPVAALPLVKGVP